MKVKSRKLDNKDRMIYLEALYTAISTLKSREEIKGFLRDLLTSSERIMLGRRILIAKKLLEGKLYSEIVEEMKVGMDTIMRVHRWLEDENKNRGYEKVIKDLEKVFKVREDKISKYKDYPATEFGRLKRRYPLHFFLFNLFDELNGKS
ncbi:MAG: YerC/YecD family TrpR-related protein [Patescibacteria group bacterium]